MISQTNKELLDKAFARFASMAENAVKENDPFGMAKGSLVMVTPNGGHISIRLKILKSGSWPYDSLRSLYYSTPPFLGHHRLYSIRDLDRMLHWAGFKRDRNHYVFFDMGSSRGGTLKWRLFQSLIYRPFFRHVPTWRHSIWAVYDRYIK